MGVWKSGRMPYNIGNKHGTLPAFFSRFDLYMTRHNENGNILFLILIACALFGLLSYVMTQTTRSGGGNLSADHAKFLKAQLENITVSVSTAVMRRKFDSKCTNKDIEENFCPPSAADCSSIPKPQCNIADDSNAERAIVNWLPSAAGPTIRIQGQKGLQTDVEVAMEGGDDITTDYHLLQLTYRWEGNAGNADITPFYMICEDMNARAALPAPAVIEAMADAAEDTVFMQHGTGGDVCVYNKGSNPPWIKIYSAISKDSE